MFFCLTLLLLLLCLFFIFIYFFLAQSFLNYVLLCVVFTVMLACRQDSEGRHLGIMLRQDGWKYAILGLIDVEANYLVVKAYTYTTITSIQVTQEVVAGCSKDFAAIFSSTVLSPNGS